MRLGKVSTKLLTLSKGIKNLHISELHNQNELAEKTVKHNLLDFDYSKQRISNNILDYLLQIPDQINLRDSPKHYSTAHLIIHLKTD